MARRSTGPYVDPLTYLRDLVYRAVTSDLPRDPAFRLLCAIAGVDPVAASWTGYRAWAKGTSAAICTGGIRVELAVEQAVEHVWHAVARRAVLESSPVNGARAGAPLTREQRIGVVSLLLAALDPNDIAGLLGLRPLLLCRRYKIEQALRSILRADLVASFESADTRGQWLERLIDDVLFVARMADSACLDRLVAKVKKATSQRTPARHLGAVPGRPRRGRPEEGEAGWPVTKRLKLFTRAMLQLGLSERAIVQVNSESTRLAYDSARVHRGLTVQTARRRQAPGTSWVA